MANKTEDNTEVNNNENQVPEPTPYKGQYRKDVYNEEPEQKTEEQDTSTEATPEQSGFMSGGDRKPQHDFKKRYDDLKHHYDRTLAENKQKVEELEAKLKVAQQPKFTPSKTDDELKTFKDKYPDVYGVVETVAHKQANAQVEGLQSEISKLRERETELVTQSAYKELTNAHPDFTALKDAPEFLDWLQTQPPSIADGVTKNNTDSKWAIRVIDLYKADAGISKSKTKSKSAADAVTRTSSKNVNVENKDGKKVWKSSEILKLKPWEYAKVEQEIDTALREGRVVRDTK